MKHVPRMAGLVVWAGSLAWAQTDNSYAISTVAGGGTVSGDGGPAVAAVLFAPTAVALDGSGNLYIADRDNHRVRRVTPAGVTTVAGSGVPGFGGDGGSALTAQLRSPSGVAVDRAGNLYIADRDNQRVRRVTASGMISTVAGAGNPGFTGDGGPATSALLNGPEALAVDAAGNIYIADRANHRIRRVTPAGMISTFAGAGASGFGGDGNPATSALLDSPEAVAVDAAGNVYLADRGNHRVRRVTAAGVIATVAGDGTQGYDGDGGEAVAASLDSPAGVAVDGSGNLWIADTGNHRVRRVGSGGGISTVAGSGLAGYGGDGDRAGLAQLNVPRGLAIDASGNLLIADRDNHRVRQVNAAGRIATLAGAGAAAGDGGPATSAQLFFPSGAVLDPAGGLYISDSAYHRVRRVTGVVISTVAGTGSAGFSGDQGQATAARLSSPRGLALDGGANLYIADRENNRVRRVSTAGVISTVAGLGASGPGGEEALLSGPAGVAVDQAGNLYIADRNNHRVQRVTPVGEVSTVAGTGTAGFNGDEEPAPASQLSSPSGVTVDDTGNLYIADRGNHRIRRVTPSGAISTFAGSGAAGFSGDGSSAITAALNSPEAVAVDRLGNLYLSDRGNQRIRKVDLVGRIHTIAGSGSQGFGGDGASANFAQLSSPAGLSVDRGGNVFFADEGNHRIRRLVPNPARQFAMASGSGQSGPAGTRLPNPLVIRVVGSTGAGVGGLLVTFGVTSGSGVLSATSVTTGAEGTAAVQLTLGNTEGTVTVTAFLSGFPSVIFTLTATAPAAGTAVPRLSAGGVVGAGLSVPRVREISPHAIISIFGENFAPAGTERLVGASDLVNGRLPVMLEGVCVEIASRRAPIFHLFPGQLNIQVPSLSGEATVPVQVIRDCGLPAERRSNVEMVPLQAASPEFFFFTRNPDGRNPIAAVHPAGGLVGAPELFPGATTPAQPGDVVTLFGTGLGATVPAFAAGELPDRIAPTAERVTVTVEGIPLRDEEVLYAGATPFLAGVYQLNIRIPANAPDGDLRVTARVRSFSTPPGGFITVRR